MHRSAKGKLMLHLRKHTVAPYVTSVSFVYNIMTTNVLMNPINNGQIKVQSCLYKSLMQYSNLIHILYTTLSCVASYSMS